MQASLFENTSNGRLVPTTAGMQAFVPNRLPPDIKLENIINEFGEASAALGGLDKLGSTISNPNMVIRPLQRAEALKSSAMEGTFSTADNLALIDSLNKSSTADSTREVHAYIQAIDYAVNQIETLPISHRLIKGMHAVLFGQALSARGGNKRPGEYKNDQNWIGAPQIQRRGSYHRRLHKVRSVWMSWKHLSTPTQHQYQN